MEAAIISATDQAVIEAAKQIKLLLVDVDGVLTDGRLSMATMVKNSKLLIFKMAWGSSYSSVAAFR